MRADRHAVVIRPGLDTELAVVNLADLAGDGVFAHRVVFDDVLDDVWDRERAAKGELPKHVVLRYEPIRLDVGVGEPEFTKEPIPWVQGAAAGKVGPYRH